MVAYNFQPQFISKIESGQKHSTIRLPRKNGHAKVGDKVQLYVGMRTKNCRKIIPDSMCVKRQQIRVAGYRFSYSQGATEYDIAQLATMEGFESVGEMMKWFSQAEYQGVWLEQIIWQPPNPVVQPKHSSLLLSE